MAAEGERALDVLLRMRYFLAGELDITRNHLLGVEGIDPTGLDQEGAAMHERILSFLRQKYAANVACNRFMLAELDGLVHRSCNHDMVEDDVEDPMSGELTRIRYCRVCEFTPQ
jgi:hypothetical protein